MSKGKINIIDKITKWTPMEQKVELGSIEKKRIILYNSGVKTNVEKWNSILKDRKKMMQCTSLKQHARNK